MAISKREEDEGQLGMSLTPMVDVMRYLVMLLVLTRC